MTEFEKRIIELEKENLLLREKVAFLTQKLYGRSTEQTSSLGMEGQMSLFDEAEITEDKKAVEPDMKEVSGYYRKRKKGQKEALLNDLPHIKRLCILTEEERFCEECGTPLVSVGEEFVRSEIEFIPAKVQVIDYYRETFECRTCRKQGKPCMEKSIVPDPLINLSNKDDDSCRENQISIEIQRYL